MSDDIRFAIKAVLVRAADWEARRQAAIQRGDDAAREAAERELQRLYHEHQQLDAQAGRAA